MDVIELIPGLHFLRFPVGHAYLCADPDGLTLIDTSVPGSAPQIAAAIRALGHDPADLRRLLLTHFHADHAGSAAQIAAWGNVTVHAHHADATFLRGEEPRPPPDLADWERPLYGQITRQLPATRPAPVRIDRELADGDELAFGGGAVVVAVPGHTPGSIAFYLPRPRILFTGDAAAARPGDGQVMPGVFNTDRAQAAASFRQLADLDAEIACFGHGEPVIQGAAALLQAAAHQLSGWMLLIAGPARSGKSTFARRVVRRFGAVQVSFGDAIRQRARETGSSSERRELQQIGEQWVANDPGGLCDKVLTAVNGRPKIVIDGVRHMEIYRYLQMRADGRRVVLIFMETPSSIRRIRLAKDGADAVTAKATMAHSTESELPLIRRSADLIVDGSCEPKQALYTLGAMLGSSPRLEE